MALTVEKYEVASVDRAEVLRYMGYAGQVLTEELDTRIDEVVARCLAVARPAGVWEVFEVAGREPTGAGVPAVQLAGTSLQLEGESIQKHLVGAVAVGVMAVTVGMGVERELRRLSLTDAIARVIFDAAGTTAVERAADACEASVVAAAHERGLYTNFRFSPGYGDMPLAQSGQICEVLNAGRSIGLTVSQSGILMPRKSVTAVLGISRTQVLRRPKGCEGCSARQTCAFARREDITEE